MTVEEARVAVRVNAIVQNVKRGSKGYVYSLSWVHLKGKDPYISVGVHDFEANSVISENLLDLKIEDWNAPDYLVNDWISKERERMKD